MKKILTKFDSQASTNSVYREQFVIQRRADEVMEQDINEINKTLEAHEREMGKNYISLDEKIRLKTS